MGRRDRERIARIISGEESPRVREKVRDAGVAMLQRTSTSNQVQFLADSLHSGKLSPEKLRKALEDSAGKEMRKGAIKLKKKGKTPTVELLLADYRKDKEFQKLASEVGLNEDWFVQLAETECQRWENKQ